MASEKYDQPGFIPAEVLVTLARGRYGGSARVRNEIALALNRQVFCELAYFLKVNPDWYPIIARDGEQAAEAVSEVQLRIFKSTAEVSFSEVAFRMFVSARLFDWCNHPGHPPRPVPGRAKKSSRMAWYMPVPMSDFCS